jgi:hypothetical protein
MKRFVFIGILLFCFTIVQGQVKKNVTGKQAITPAKKQQQKKITETKTKDTLISLTSTSNNSAKATSSMQLHNNTSTITDPTIVALGERAKGNEVFISNSGIVGMPKRAYGFANGRILFHSTVATSSGSTGGSCSVGTGGSISGMGSSGAFIGLNGKSPYAGQGMWGNARGLTIYPVIK